MDALGKLEDFMRERYSNNRAYYSDFEFQKLFREAVKQVIIEELSKMQEPK